MISKNANVATGQQGHADALEVARLVADRVGCAVDDVIVTSTGVIGRRYPMDRIRAGLGAIPSPLPRADADGPSVGMMTTDTVPKVAEATVAGSSGPRRRHGQGGRDDRARHGHAHLAAVHRRRGVLDRPRRDVPPGRRLARSTASASTPTRRRATRPIDPRVGPGGRRRPGGLGGGDPRAWRSTSPSRSPATARERRR